MLVETVKMSSRGQLVIPQDVRDELGLEEGTIFALVTGKDVILLKKMHSPSKDELLGDLEAIAREGKHRLQAKGIEEKDISDIVGKARRK